MNWEVHVRRQRGDIIAVTTIRGVGVGSLTANLLGLDRLIEEFEKSDLPEADKRQARALVEGFELQRPTLSEIGTLHVIFDRSEPMRTQALHWLQLLFK
jgi:hypothetical protein